MRPLPYTKTRTMPRQCMRAAKTYMKNMSNIVGAQAIVYASTESTKHVHRVHATVDLQFRARYAWHSKP